MVRRAAEPLRLLSCSLVTGLRFEDELPIRPRTSERDVGAAREDSGL